jgi:hypothetical protein
MSRTERAETAHGDVRYSVVECDSCGCEVTEEDARTFVVGEVDKREYRAYKDALELQFRDPTVVTGHVCPHCRDDPASFPSAGGVVAAAKPMLADPLVWPAILSALVLGLLVIMAVVA